jgi:hypothetical protein
MATQEQYVNDPGTTLASSCTSGATTISVVSSTGYPSLSTTGQQFRIRIDSELMLVTAISGTTWTITRGIESTGAASHSSGATVNAIVTAGMLDAMRINESNIGTYANLPGTGLAKQGDRYILNDGNLEYAFDGTNWQPFYSSRMGTANASMPSSGSFTLFGSTNTLTNSKGCLLMTSPTSNAWGVCVQSVPATPYSLEVGFTFISAPGAAAGICVSDGTKYEYLTYNSANNMDVQYNTALNTYSSNPVGLSPIMALQPTWMKITVDSSHKTMYIGDGNNYVQYYQESATNNLTTAYAGLVMLGGTLSGATGMMNVFYYKLG